MPLAAAEGGISIAEHNLAVTLATTARFQQFVGAPDLETAWKRVHFTAWPKPANGHKYNPAELDQYMPSALIYTGEASGWSQSRIGFKATQQSGMVMFNLEEAVIGDDYAESERLFKNTVGVIVDQMYELVDSGGGYMAITQIVCAELLRLGTNQEVDRVANRATLIAIWGMAP